MLCCAPQSAATRHDLQGALSVLFREPQQALVPNSIVSPAQFHNLDQKMLELECIFDLLEQQPYAGSPAMRWGCILSCSHVMPCMAMHVLVTAGGRLGCCCAT
jgi:hypothetical protein